MTYDKVCHLPRTAIRIRELFVGRIRELFAVGWEAYYVSGCDLFHVHERGASGLCPSFMLAHPFSEGVLSDLPVSTYYHDFVIYRQLVVLVSERGPLFPSCR